MGNFNQAHASPISGKRERAGSRNRDRMINLINLRIWRNI
jgi:hypothetical protein